MNKIGRKGDKAVRKLVGGPSFGLAAGKKGNDKVKNEHNASMRFIISIVALLLTKQHADTHKEGRRGGGGRSLLLLLLLLDPCPYEQQQHQQ